MPGVNYNSVQSAMTMSSMAGTMAGMSSLGGAGQAGTANLPAASSYPGTSSPYPGSTSPLSSAMQVDTTPSLVSGGVTQYCSFSTL